MRRQGSAAATAQCERWWGLGRVWPPGVVAISSTLILAGYIALYPLPANAQACNGDCGGDGAVSVDELIVGVGIVLGDRPLTDCAALDANRDGAVGVADLVAAVGHLLAGVCGASGSLRGALNGSQTAIGLTQIIDLGRASAAGAGLAGARIGGAAGLREIFPPFLAPCPDGGDLLVECASDGALSLLDLTFIECYVCDRPPLIDTQLPAQLADARDIIVDGVFRELVTDPLLCFTFNAPIFPGASFQQDLDGLLEYTDATSGLRFRQFFDDLKIDGVVEPDGSRTIDLDGGVEDCEGAVELLSLEPIEVLNSQPCPRRGRVRVVAGEQAGEIRYTATGGVELDEGADGSVDERFDDCRDARTDRCGSAGGAPPECTVPRPQCLACDNFTDCGLGRTCVPCQRDCTGEPFRCGPEVLYAACEDGIFGPVEPPR
jgi:hypothetical protein